MIRASTLTALGLALAVGGAATAQQTSGGATASGGTAAEVGAPASDETGIKGVYATKSMMGISTGPTVSAEADAAEASEASADATGEDGQSVSN